MVNGKMLPCHGREAIVTVFSYKNGIMDGYLQHPGLEEKKEFRSLSQLMLELNQLLDTQKPPNSLQFPLVYLEKEEKRHRKRFRIDVLFQEHHTWQGKLILEDEKQEAVFRSVMELMELIDEILGE